VDELRKLRHEVTYMRGREESLQQELGERTQEVQAMRERLSGLQEKHNGLRLEALRLEQKVGTAVAPFCTGTNHFLVQHGQLVA
jgi:predicted  nucleic acid-binding Zn-ribbon protein